MRNIHLFKKIAVGSLMLCSLNAFALQERHLILMRAAEAEHNITHQYNSDPKHPAYIKSSLTAKGHEEVKKAAESLLSHGFDNRSIVAVYVSPLPRAVEMANIMSKIGVFESDKIHIDKRLAPRQAGDKEGKKAQDIQELWWVGVHEANSHHAESNIEMRKRMVALYDSVEKKYTEGHIIFITHGAASMELIEILSKDKVKLQTAQSFLLPLAKRSDLA